jgi:DtxR family Mn-dependent transcriptional regulator
MQIQIAEENYLRVIFLLGRSGAEYVSTNAIADRLKTKPSSVTDMLKRLSEKKLVSYVKYKGVKVSALGKNVALETVRKHRLWEVFLVEHLFFGWEEVHEVAEQLEHIQSKKLIEKLDEFLGYPKYDPHGDPIPNNMGEMPKSHNTILMSELELNKECHLVGVKDSSKAFLTYLDGQSIKLGSEFKVEARFEYDGSLNVILDNNKSLSISQQVAKNLLVSCHE